MYDRKIRILWNKEIGQGYFRLGFACPQEFLSARPGQFVMFKCSGGKTPLLRRPFSIHRLIDNGDQTAAIELLYKVIGETTRLMAQLQRGDSATVLGPLGKGFDLPHSMHRIYLAAGGVGVAPLVFLASALYKSIAKTSTVTVFLGGRSKTDLLCASDFKEMEMDVIATTDDGSEGRHCLVTDPLELAVNKNRPDMIYTCGPSAMMDCVIGIAEKYDVPCQVSIETMMACGIGACLGCAVASRDDPETYLHACMDGPVFDSKQLKFQYDFH